MNAATRKILDDLKNAGLDVSSIETQASVNPFADKQLDNLLGGGIMRQQEYTRYMNEIKRKETSVQEQVNNLASLHDSVESLKDNDVLYQAALEKITALEDALIESGGNPEEVKKVSFVEKQGLTMATTKKDENAEVNKGDTTMSKNFVDADEFQKGMATMALGSVAVSAKANRLIREAEKLGIDVTPEMEENLLTGIQNRFGAGTATLEQVADEVLGLSKKRIELQQADVDKRIAEAEAKGRAEARAEVEKEFGGAPRRQVGRKEGPVYSRDRSNLILPQNENGLKKADDGRIEVPLNAKGEPELFKLRQSRGHRVGTASALFNDEEAMSKLGAVAD